jgi:hypothetical protein
LSENRACLSCARRTFLKFPFIVSGSDACDAIGCNREVPPVARRHASRYAARVSGGSFGDRGGMGGKPAGVAAATTAQQSQPADKSRCCQLEMRMQS